VRQRLPKTKEELSDRKNRSIERFDMFADPRGQGRRSSLDVRSFDAQRWLKEERTAHPAARVRIPPVAGTTPKVVRGGLPEA